MCEFWASWLTFSAHTMDKSSVWLFLGPEIGEKQTAVDEIKKRLNCGEETVFYAGETAVPLMVSNIRNASLFADSRLFIIKSAEGIKKKDDVDILSACLNLLPDNTFIILISDETSVAKGLESSIPQGNKKVFWELLDSRKTEWVRDFFRREGFTISGGGIETILELVENNTSALKQECSRLTLFLDKGKDITAKDAEKWLSHTREESAFTLFSRIATGDFSRSLESLRTLLAAKEVPVVIFAGLSYCFRKLGSYLALTEAGITSDFEFRKIGVSAPGVKRDYAAAAKRFDSAAAERCLALTTEYDFRLRASLSFPEHILMGEYLYKIFSLQKGTL